MPENGLMGELRGINACVKRTPPQRARLRNLTLLDVLPTAQPDFIYPHPCNLHKAKQESPSTEQQYLQGNDHASEHTLVLETLKVSPIMAESHPVDAPLQAAIESESDNESGTEQVLQTDGTAPSASDPTAAKKKTKKSKRSKIASALTGSTSSDSTSKSKVSQANIDALLEMNPSLKGELSGLSPSQAQTLLSSMDPSQLLTGLTLNPKNQKDMASYKFWQTQPVPRLDEAGQSTSPAVPDGPIKEVIPEKVPKDPAPLPESYEWCVLDLTSPAEIKEVYTLLSNHYVEDDNAMFRFSYSESFLDWALKSPHWKKSWHIGVRAKGPSKLLVATIFGIPTKLRVRENILDVVEINFLCIHKKLRAKRLAPVLIKEITRRCHLEGVYQAVYTAGVVLPTPVGTCRYFHRSLDWSKLYDVGFSPLPPGRSKSQMVARNALPGNTSTKGWREMEVGDVDAVLDLLGRYLKRFHLAQEFTREEVEHWFVSKRNDEERVVWAFVVEDETTGKITDLVSFYCLESSVIGEASKKHEKVRAAYLFYYATETAFASEEKGLKERLLSLLGDGLIEAKKVSSSMHAGLTDSVCSADSVLQAKFDVFNALTLHDNPLFLEQLKFGAGDGQLHYYLYNWRTAGMKGGVNRKNEPDTNARGGIGMVLL